LVSRVEQLASLVYTIKEGVESLGKVGHTLLQKLFYLLQHGEGVMLGYKYKLYYYGPYCQDLWSDLHILHSEDLINIEPSPDGFGYIIGLGNETGRINSLEKLVKDETREKAKKLLSLLGGEPVKSLESLATTHYVYSDLRRNKSKDFSKKLVVEKVLALKPHLNESDVQRAIQILEENDLV